MGFSRKKIIPLTIVALSVSALLATQAAGADGDRRADPAVSPAYPNSAQATQGRHQPGPPVDPSPAPAGDIGATVPFLPDLRALHGLCTAYLGSDDREKKGDAFKVLVGATGGSSAATTAWCRVYLTLRVEEKTSAS